MEKESEQNKGECPCGKEKMQSSFIHTSLH